EKKFLFDQSFGKQYHNLHLPVLPLTKLLVLKDQNAQNRLLQIVSYRKLLNKRDGHKYFLLVLLKELISKSPKMKQEETGEKTRDNSSFCSRVLSFDKENRHKPHLKTGTTQ